MEDMMKNVILIMMVLAGATVARAADGVQFTTVTSWQQALDLAKAQNKPIFLDAYTDWCGWCKVMDKETFSNAEVASVMNAAFVNVKMEMETGGGIDVSMKYRITGFPTFMVFSPDGTPTYRTAGYHPPKDWLKTLAEMQEPSKRMQYKGATSSIELPWPDWHRASFAKGKARVFPDTAVARKWFRAQSDKFGEVAFGVLQRHDMGDEIEQWALANEEKYRDLYGDDVDALREALVRRAYMKAVKNKDVALLQQAKDLVPGRDPLMRARTHRRLEAMYYQGTNDWKSVGGVVKAMVADDDLSAVADNVNDLAWSIYEKTDDADAIAAAIEGMAKVVALPKSDWAHVDTYAALLYKAGRMADALAAAERAIALGTAQGADVKETEALLAKIKAAKK
jgi:thioredoxin-related protein